MSDLERREGESLGQWARRAWVERCHSTDKYAESWEVMAQAIWAAGYNEGLKDSKKEPYP